MLGAIVGDISGSRFEWRNLKSKEFDLLTYHCHLTDDSNMTLAVAQAILQSKKDWSDLPEEAVKAMRELGKKYPHGYGSRFKQWLLSAEPQPYGSWGNGSAMRVSPCAWAAGSLEEALLLSDAVTGVTHNHPEGIKGARAITSAIWMARNGSSILEIRDHIHDHYYPLDFTLDQIREEYSFDVSCQGSVPQAIEAFLESTGFEDAIRNAISIGGDSDTIAAMAGSIAEAYYGIPADIRKHALTFLDETQLGIVMAFEQQYGMAIEKNINENMSRQIEYKPRANQKKEDAGSRSEMMLDSVKTTEQAEASTTIESQETSATKLFNHLYQACNILHGHIGHEDFKSYIIPLLFLQRVSDCYDEETQDAIAQYGDDVDLFDEEEIHAFIIPDGCHWNDLRQTTEDVGQAIVNAMMGIEHANPNTMSGLYSAFDDASWTDKGRLTDADLKDLIEHMSSVKKGNRNYSADIMGDAYEFLIKKFADLSKKNAGEFYTPRSIVKLMVQMLAPKPGETVYDPACGTGGMLIEAIRQMQNEQAAYGRIFGQEKNLSTSAIARMNLFLHGAKEFSILREDTLTHPQFLSGGSIRRFDCVLANPPFGLKGWGAEAFSMDQYGRNIWGCPPDSNADFAWLQHMVCSMKKDTGRCAVVMPQGVLFHGGKEGEIRKQLIESDKLEAVITLVGGVFYGAGVSACILYLNNHKAASHQGKICMIDASTIYTPKRAQNIMTEEDIAKVYRLWQDYQNVIDFAAVVDLDTVRAKDYTLSVNSYIEKTQAPTISPGEVRKNFMAALAEVKAAEEELTKLLMEGGYIHG
ncbi:MAG: N-6 DNA methylase [Clostridia bacterium]|nr:N-6 DNA methylase [Clostridia bacterium]